MDTFHTEQFWFSLLRSDSPRDLWRPELEVIFLLQGTGRIYSPGLNAACALREADIFVVNSFEVQEFELDAGSAALSFSVSPQFINNVAPELLTHRVNCRSFLYADEEQPAFHALRQDLARAFQMFYKRENDGTAYVKSGAAAILEDLGRYFLDRNQRVEYSGAQESLQKITQYVQHNYRQRVTLDELSKHTFLSKTYISRMFTRYLGISFWGRMRFREMTDPVNQFTRWYQIVPRGGFNNIYASFPSGHSMNSAGVILLMLLPPMIPALQGKEKALHTFVYIWCALVGISRVFMGAHFSSDVTVGVLLSLAIFEVLRAILYRNVPQNALTKT